MIDTGILSLAGTRTGHLAIVSREYRIPCMPKTSIVGELEGREILLDARDPDTARIYACPRAPLETLAASADRAALEAALGATAAALEVAFELLTAAGYLDDEGGRCHLAEPGRRALARA